MSNFYCPIDSSPNLHRFHYKSSNLPLIYWFIHLISSMTFQWISTPDLRCTIEKSAQFKSPAEKSSTRNISQYQVSYGKIIIVEASIHPLEKMRGELLLHGHEIANAIDRWRVRFFFERAGLFTLHQHSAIFSRDRGGWVKLSHVWVWNILVCHMSNYLTFVLTYTCKDVKWRSVHMHLVILLFSRSLISVNWQF